jgi:hypothetical protein
MRYSNVASEGRPAYREADLLDSTETASPVDSGEVFKGRRRPVLEHERVGRPFGSIVAVNVARVKVISDATPVVTTGAVGGPDVMNDFTGPVVVPCELAATTNSSGIRLLGPGKEAGCLRTAGLR